MPQTEKKIQQKKCREQSNKTALFAMIIFFIPLYAWFYGTTESPFQYTFSMMGNRFGITNRISFIIWGIVTGVLLLIFIIRLFVLEKFKDKRAIRLLYISCASLVLTVIIPAVEHLPFWGNMHTLFASLFGLSLVGCLYAFIKYLGQIDRGISIRSMWLLFLTVAGSLVSLIFRGNTGIYEMFFFLSVSVVLMVLNYWITFRQKKDITDAEKADIGKLKKSE